MLTHCANSACVTRFRKLEDGKLFLVEVDTAEKLTSQRDEPARLSRRLEHYWLCGPCASVLTLSFERERGVVAVPLMRRLRKMPAAPGRTGEAVHAPRTQTMVANSGPTLAATGVLK
jgi:hypothetical protein